MTKEMTKGIAYLKKRDEVINRLIAQIGPCELKPSSDYFRSLAKSIISQQLSNQAARSIYLKLLHELNGELTPQKISSLGPLSFQRAGISKQKSSYLMDLANRFIGKEIDIDMISKSGDEQVIDSLTKIRGIGIWSAKMFLIFCLNRLNVLPHEDVGFRRALIQNYSLVRVPSERKIKRIAGVWEPYRSIAVWYLWQSVNK